MVNMALQQGPGNYSRQNLFYDKNAVGNRRSADASTEMLILSDNYLYDFTKTELFEMEDLIVSRVVNSMKEHNGQSARPALELIELKRNEQKS
jgi:hypothetical protein